MDVYTNHHGTREARIFDKASGDTLAKLDGDCANLEMNARAIAALPELLAALRLVTESAADYCAGYSIIDDDVLDRARAALAKAEGKD